MENIEKKVRQKIEWILNQQCGGVKREQRMAQLAGLSIICAITSMVSGIEKEKQALIDSLQEENKALHSQLNQLSFRSDPARDRQLLQLQKMGLFRKQIGKRLGMSAWGLSKALRWIGVNSVDRVRETPEK